MIQKPFLTREQYNLAKERYKNLIERAEDLAAEKLSMPGGHANQQLRNKIRKLVEELDALRERIEDYEHNRELDD